MLLEKEELKEGLSPEQIQAIENEYATKEAELKSLANKNADGIFNGAAEKLTGLTGIKKEEKEKYSDYFARLADEWLPTVAEQKVLSAEKKANDKVLELEEKIKNHKGDESLKEELKKAKEELGKIPDLLTAKENEWKTKYDDEVNNHKSYKVNTSINSSMPKFDESVNEFELKAKKKQAIDRIKTEYELSFDSNGNLIGTKDYQKYLVSDLLKQDADLKDLVLIEQNQGGGGEGGQSKGKTLSLPTDITKGAAQHLIQTHIVTNENISILDDKFEARFKELCKENNVL